MFYICVYPGVYSLEFMTTKIVLFIICNIFNYLVNITFIKINNTFNICIEKH